MEINFGVALASAIIFFIYGAMSVITAIFTVSIDTYKKLDELLNLNLFSSKVLTPLDLNLDPIDDWLMNNNKIVGPLLSVLCIIDMKLFFDLLNSF